VRLRRNEQELRERAGIGGDSIKDGSGTARLRAKGLVGGVVYVIVLAVVLFVSSGRLGWAMAWALLAVHLIGTSVVTLIVSPALIEERSGRKADAKKWDSTLVSAMSIMGLVALLVAGLDVRFGWSGPLPMPVEAAGMVLLVSGYAIVDWATVTNKFFSTVVRIQADRGHTVISEGPYGYVRHPGYIGLVICVLAQPLMLGSLWALLPAAVTIMILIVRTSLEDRTLQDELTGYKEYVQRVRYRLLPGIW